MCTMYLYTDHKINTIYPFTYLKYKLLSFQINELLKNSDYFDGSKTEKLNHKSPKQRKKFYFNCNQHWIAVLNKRHHYTILKYQWESGKNDGYSMFTKGSACGMLCVFVNHLSSSFRLS